MLLSPFCSSASIVAQSLLLISLIYCIATFCCAACCSATCCVLPSLVRKLNLHVSQPGVGVCGRVQLDCDIASMTVWQCAAAYLSGSVGADLSVTYLLRNAEEHKGSHEAFNVLAINSLQLARTEAINLNYNSRQADTCSHTPTHARTHKQTHSVIDSAVIHVVYVLRVALSVCGTLLLSFRGHPLQTHLVYLPLCSPFSFFLFSLPSPSACLPCSSFSSMQAEKA